MIVVPASGMPVEAAAPGASSADDAQAWLNDLTRLQPWWDSHAFLPPALQAELAAAVLPHVLEAGARQWLQSVQSVQSALPPDPQTLPLGVVLRQALADFARQRPRLALAAALSLAVMAFKLGRAMREWVA